MKNLLKTIVMLLFCLFLNSTYAQFKSSSKTFSTNKTYSEWSEYDCNCHFEVDFLAFVNAYIALANEEANNWLHTREDAYKRELENRLNQEFNSFQDAQYHFFKNGEFTQNIANQYYENYIENNSDERVIYKIEAKKFYARSQLFYYRYLDGLSITNGTGSIYDFGDLKYNDQYVRDYMYYNAYQYYSSNNDNYNSWKNLISDNGTKLAGLLEVRDNEELESFFASKFINHYNNIDNYKTRIQLMLDYLVWNLAGTQAPYIPYPNFPNRYNLQSYDFSNNLSDMISNSGVDYQNYNLNYDFETIKTYFVINEMFNDYSKSFVNNRINSNTNNSGSELFSGIKNYLVVNNFSENEINYINDYFRRYNTNGYMTADDRIDGVYESNDKSFQTEDRPENILTFKLSQDALDEGLYGIIPIWEYMSLNGWRNDFEGHHIALILSEIGIPNVYQNFTYEELAYLFDFKYTQNDYIKIVFAPYINDYLNYDDIYGTSIFTDPLKVKILKSMAQGNIGVSPFIDSSLQNTCAEEIITDFILEDFSSLAGNIEIEGLINKVFDIISLNNSNVNFHYRANSNISGWGKTESPVLNNQTGKYDIIINLKQSLINNGTKLAIAKTILHESIHAYLEYFRKLHPVAFANINGDFTSLINAYRQYQNLATSHHVYMGNLIDEMAYQLKYYSTNYMDYPTTSNSYSPYNINFYYEAVAWSGIAVIEDPQNPNSTIVNPIYTQNYPNNANIQDVINIFNSENFGSTFNGQNPVINNNCN